MLKIKLQIDRRRYSDKPKDDINAVKARTQKLQPVVLELTALIERIEQGYTISPGVLSGGLKAANWTEQQLFMVDIDNDKEGEKLTAAEALEVCENHGIRPAFYYPTFSDSAAKPKFRLAFICDKAITDPAERKAIISSLIDLFPQSDTGCLNADRIFFGTNKKAVICDLSVTFKAEDVVGPYTQPEATTAAVFDLSKDFELDRLKKEFDFLGYLSQRNGKHTAHGAYIAFDDCEICGHHDCLRYYPKTNTAYCFGANGKRGGSVIDYLMAAEKLDRAAAIRKFKHELCRIPEQTYTLEQKREYAIQKNTPCDADIVENLKAVDAYSKYSHDDKGLGALLGDVFRDRVRYNVTAKEWYIYDGKVWKEDTAAVQVSRYAKELADALLVYAVGLQNIDEDRRRKYVDFVNRLGKLSNRKTMIEDSKDRYPLCRADLDKDIHLLNCQNGTLDLKVFKFRPHSSQDLLSKISNVIYDPNAESPAFERFMADVMQGDDQKIHYLQKILGYSLTGGTELETCFILYGATTRNGKSTLVETFAYMLGSNAGYALNIRPETLAVKQNNDSRQANDDIARLKDCRFVNAAEPPKRMLFDTGLLKTLIGRDTITARHLHERNFEFVPVFKLFINTNFLPLITDDTLFSSGRINIITFDRHFAPHEQDKTLKDKLKMQENLSGIFNWCLEGLRSYYKEGAKPPSTVTAATAEYRANSDKVGNFIRECLEACKENSKALDVYNAYQYWCEVNGYRAENKSNFFAELKSKNLLYSTGTVNGKTISNVVKGYKIADWQTGDFCQPPPSENEDDDAIFA